MGQAVKKVLSNTNKKKKRKKDQNPHRHIVAVCCYCGRDFHFIQMASSGNKKSIKDLTQKSKKTSCEVKVMPELKCKMRRSGNQVAMQERGWSQAPERGLPGA